MVKVKVGDTIIPAVVDTGCSQSMIWAELFPAHLGILESLVSMVCIHGASYTYECRKIQLTVLSHTEEIAVGLAETLPCPMLLGVDWPHLEEVIARVITKRGGKWERDSRMAFFRDPKEDEQENLDIEQLIGEGYFQEEQRQEPLFQNVWVSQLAKDEGEIVDPQKARQSPKYEVRRGILYQIENQGNGEKRCQILIPLKYWEALLQIAHTLPMGGHLG